MAFDVAPLTMPQDKPFELTEKQTEQRDMAASPARHILAYGGSRSGKTFGFVRCIIVRALMAPRSRHGIFRLHNIDVKQSVMMDTFPTVMRLCYPDTYYDINRSDQVAFFEDDQEIWFGGLDDKERVEKILGKEFATVYPNECSQIPYDSITTMRTRLAQNVYKRNGKLLELKAYYDLNPVGKRHWSHREFKESINPVDRRPIPKKSRVYIQMNPRDNPNLSEAYHEELDMLPPEKRKRFKDGNYQSDLPNAIWPQKHLDGTRVHTYPKMKRIGIGVDPSGSDGLGGDGQGIVVAGLGVDDHAYVLEDGSCRKSPAGWAEEVERLRVKWDADFIVAEKNYGGAMVEANIRTVNKQVKVIMVQATRGKHVRAEPVAALYENRPQKPATVHHVGYMDDLEDQMAQFDTEGYQGSGSPDRADAAVWILTELMFGAKKMAGLLAKQKHRGASK